MSSHPRDTIQPWIIAGLAALSVTYSAAASYAALHGAGMSDSTEVLWMLVFSILVTLWAWDDELYPVSRATGEYSYLLMFFFWPVVLLYHLVHSRGFRGFMMYVGFLSMNLAPYFMQALISAGIWERLAAPVMQ